MSIKDNNITIEIRLILLNVTISVSNSLTIPNIKNGIKIDLSTITPESLVKIP